MFMLQSCSTTPMVSPTQTQQAFSERLTAEIYGELLSVDGCLRLKTEDGMKYQLFWPSDFEVDMGNGFVKVTDTWTGEKKVLQIGEMAWFAGGESRTLGETALQSIPSNCQGPYWIVGGIEMPGTLRNLILSFEFEGVKVETADEISDHGFILQGEILRMNGDQVFAYEFANEKLATNEAALVSPDGFTITRPEGEGIVEINLGWISTPYFYQKDRLIAIYAGENLEVMDILESFFGPQFAGGNR
jgi:hypothetical protein